jgi:hypothetical protein
MDWSRKTFILRIFPVFNLARNYKVGGDHKVKQ